MAARFDAFISYSRAASSTLAVELRNGIERFAKPWYRLRSSHVFLDDASMSANTGLWSNIEKALTEADWFILICSPKAAASEYVTNELTWWLQHKTADRILLVLDEGTMVWDAKAGDFDWKKSTAVNHALAKAFAEEPRWIEMPWFDAEGSLKAADPRFPERVADLAAAVRGLERDEIVGENVRQRRRALRLLRGGVIALSGLLVASLVATGIAVVNGNAAAEQARIAQARQLAAQAIVASTTDLQLASLLAVEAVRLHDDPQTEAALFQLQNTSPNLARSLQVGSYVRSTALGEDGTVYVGADDGTVSAWSDSKRTDLMTLPGKVWAVSVSDDQSVVAAVSSSESSLGVLVGSQLYRLDLAQTDLAGVDPVHVAVSPDGDFVAVGDAYQVTLIYRVTSGGLEPSGKAPLSGDMQFGDEGLLVFNGGPADWELLRPDDGSVIRQGSVPLSRNPLVAISGDARIIAGTTERGIDYNGWFTDTSTTVDSPADRVATSRVSGALDNALDDDGSRFATQVEGAIYVSAMRDPSEVPEAPIVLDGSGAVNFDTMAFVGDTIVTGSGEDALVWDLDAVGRGTTRIATPVPEGCIACGTPTISLNSSATRAVMNDQSAFSIVVADLRSGESTTLASPDITQAYQAAAWFDDDRLIVNAPDESALLVLSGADFGTVDARYPFTVTPDAMAIAIRTDGKRVAVLDSAGGTEVVDLASGRSVATSKAFASGFDGQAPAGYDISDDLTHAYVWWLGGLARYVDLDDGSTVYEGSKVDGMAFDASSRLHVFADGSERIVDAATGKLGTARRAPVDNVPPPIVSSAGDLVVEGDSTGVVTILDLAERATVLGRISVPVQDGKHVISAFFPDDSHLVMALQSMDLDNAPSSIRVVDLTIAGWIRNSCAVAGRDLTAAEWTDYLGTEPPKDLRCDR